MFLMLNVQIAWLLQVTTSCKVTADDNCNCCEDAQDNDPDNSVRFLICFDEANIFNRNIMNRLTESGNSFVFVLNVVFVFQARDRVSATVN